MWNCCRVGRQLLRSDNSIRVGNDSHVIELSAVARGIRRLPDCSTSSVWTVDGHDRIAIYHAELRTDFDLWTDAFEMAEKLGKIHSSLEQFATPNTERRWNDRLADIESGSKPTHYGEHLTANTLLAYHD